MSSSVMLSLSARARMSFSSASCLAKSFCVLSFISDIPPKRFFAHAHAPLYIENPAVGRILFRIWCRFFRLIVFLHLLPLLKKTLHCGRCTVLYRKSTDRKSRADSFLFFRMKDSIGKSFSYRFSS